jgi:uncharacterized protein YuzE
MSPATAARFSGIKLRLTHPTPTEMKITYDPEADAVMISLSERPSQESREIHPGFVLDYDTAGNITAIEILHASKRISNPRGITYELLG